MATGAIEGLRDFLAEAGIGPGDRLPPERALSQELGVSRSELRKALTVMEASGSLHRHVGRGTYLVEPPRGAGTTSLSALSERTSPHEAMVARLTLEPQLAGLAAIHASARQIGKARTLAAQMRRASTWTSYEALDSAFHETIAVAAGNSLLAELHRIVNAVRVEVVWARLDLPAAGPPPDYHSFAEHDAIIDALDRRNKTAAHDAMRAHLKSVSARLTQDD
ncbi:MAG: FCD domain-containing protein [Pseudomonadota bacterium]